jgi:hypothetical protein
MDQGYVADVELLIGWCPDWSILIFPSPLRPDDLRQIPGRKTLDDII